MSWLNDAEEKRLRIEKEKDIQQKTAELDQKAKEALCDQLRDYTMILLNEIARDWGGDLQTELIDSKNFKKQTFWGKKKSRRYYFMRTNPSIGSDWNYGHECFIYLWEGYPFTHSDGWDSQVELDDNTEGKKVSILIYTGISKRDKCVKFHVQQGAIAFSSRQDKPYPYKYHYDLCPELPYGISDGVSLRVVEDIFKGKGQIKDAITDGWSKDLFTIYPKS